MKSLERARRNSEAGIKMLRQLAAEVYGKDSGLIIGANGSFARREATTGSDIDLFYLICGNSEPKADLREAFEAKVKACGFKLPSEGGVFSEALRTNELLINIGGSEDTNTSLTRRLLLLLEGEWLFNHSEYVKIRRELLTKYVSEKTPKNKIALFLLNDIIRYWRTICVDYEYKTSDGKKAKGIRLVKLRFSRMLLVFGGIIAIAETFDLEAPHKIERLEYLLSLDVLERVRTVVGDKAENLILLYNAFLTALDNNDIRQKLSNLDFQNVSEFKDLR